MAGVTTAPAAGERRSRASGRRAVLLALSAAALMVNLDNRAVAPLLPAMAEEFATSVASAGLVVTAYALPYGLCQLGYGPLGDRLGKLRVVAAALSLFALGTGACALASSLPVLVVLRLATGAAAAGVIPLALAMLGDLYPYGERQAALGAFMTAAAVGQVLSTSVGGIVGGWVGWRVVFALFGVATVGVAAVLVHLARRERRPEPPSASPWATYAAVVRLPGVLALDLAVCIEGFLVMGGYAYLGGYLRERFGLEYAIIGLLMAGYGAMVFVGGRLVGRLVRRLGERRLMATGAVCMSGGFLFAWVLPWWPGFLGASGLMGLGWALAHSTLQTRATEAVPTARGTGLALFAFSLFLGNGLGTAFFAGLLETAGYGALLLSAGLGLLGFAVIGPTLAGARRRPRAPNRPAP